MIMSTITNPRIQSIEAMRVEVCAPAVTCALVAAARVAVWVAIGLSFVSGARCREGV
jgi:hypothetical protein